MGMFSGFAKLITYPLRRPAAEIQTSLKGVKEAVEGVKEIREKRVADAKAASAYLDGMSPQEKFNSIYEINGWSEVELQVQAQAARNTRLGMVVVAVVGVALLITMMIQAPLWMLAIIGPITVVFMAVCVALAARYAWWTDQITSRTVYPFAEFLARKDFFIKVLKP